MKYLLIVMMMFGLLLADSPEFELHPEGSYDLDTPEDSLLHITLDDSVLNSWDFRSDGSINLTEYHFLVFSIDGLTYYVEEEDIERMTDEEFENLVILYAIWSNMYGNSVNFNGREYDFKENNFFESTCNKLLPDWILERE